MHFLTVSVPTLLLPLSLEHAFPLLGSILAKMGVFGPSESQSAR